MRAFPRPGGPKEIDGNPPNPNKKRTRPNNGVCPCMAVHTASKQVCDTHRLQSRAPLEDSSRSANKNKSLHCIRQSTTKDSRARQKKGAGEEPVLLQKEKRQARTVKLTVLSLSLGASGVSSYPNPITRTCAQEASVHITPKHNNNCE